MSQSYRARNILLKALGFRSYSEYLKSELWYAIRYATLKRLGKVCSLCKKKGTVIHHLDYSLRTLLGRGKGGSGSGRSKIGGTTNSLAVVCKRCHHDIEFTTANRKRTLEEANRYYKGRLRITNKMMSTSKKVRYCPCGRVAHLKYYFCARCLNSTRNLGKI